LRFALAKLKLDPEKDVKLVQNASADPAAILASMDRGDVQFGILAAPFDRVAERRGYRTLLALPELGIPWQQNGEWVQRSYLKSNRDNVVRFMKAISDAMNIYFGQKEKTVAYRPESQAKSRNRSHDPGSHQKEHSESSEHRSGVVYRHQHRRSANQRRPCQIRGRDV
jgi:hypothetical protein